MKFKIGDEVIAIKPCDRVDSFIGRKGKVTAVFTAGRLTVNVHFEATGLYGENTWSCEENSLDFMQKREGSQYILDFDK